MPVPRNRKVLVADGYISIAGHDNIKVTPLLSLPNILQVPKPSLHSKNH